MSEPKRKFSQKYVLVNGEKYYCVSVKSEWEGWEEVGLFRKSKQKDEFGFMAEGDSLKCPHLGEVPELAWWPLPDIWISVYSLCKKCWGSHRQPDGFFNCVLRNLMVKQYRDGRTNHD